MSGTTQDTLVLTLSEDSYQGDAQFSVTVNGTQIAAGQSVTASNLEGQTEQFSYTGDFTGTDTVTVTFLNDDYAGATFDRNLYVDGVAIDGVSTSSAVVNASSGSFTGSTPVELHSTGDNASFAFSVPSSGACYLRGTRIAVPSGETAIEALRPGDLVLTASGAARPVVWIGHRQFRVADSANPSGVRPVRVRAGAVAPGVPARDLVVSPEHMLLLGDVLIPARALVNSTSVAVAPEIEAPHYFHVELESHDVLIADGMPAESWLDVGNRALFANAPVPALRPDLEATPAASACAPVVEGGAALDAIRVMLADRARAIGLAAIAATVEIAAPGAYRVAVAPGTAAVRLVSAAARCGADDRRLGATVTGVAFDGVPVALDDPRLARGFHAAERHGGHALRWTDRDALIAFGADAPGVVEIRVETVMAQVA
jgi:hypothetical protein